MKLTTGIRKKFRVSKKVKKVAPNNRLGYVFQGHQRIYLLKSLMISKKLLYYQPLQ